MFENIHGKHRGSLLKQKVFWFNQIIKLKKNNDRGLCAILSFFFYLVEDYHDKINKKKAWSLCVQVLKARFVLVPPLVGSSGST